ncbi:MAG TPA: DNA alkylation repair protein [Allosphingosinicella sp.]
MSRLDEALALLEAAGEARIRDGYGRYGIVTTNRVIGVPMGAIQAIGKALCRDHALASELWETEFYEARLLCAYVDDPALVTPEQMDRWARDFDNWGICDTLCFALFDRTEHAFEMVDRWADDEAEYVKRASFALLASLALHRKAEPDEPFLARLKLIEVAADDGRNFVKKGVNWALRAIGGRKSEVLRTAAREVAHRLAASSDKVERWVGKDAVRAFAKADAKAGD